MATTPSADRVTNPSLFNSIRSFCGVLLATLCTRADLATLELEEQAIFVAQLVIAGVVAIACIGTAFFFLMVLIIAIFWAEKVLCIAIITGIYLLGAIIAASIARTMIAKRPKLLEQTLAELRKDVDGLKKPIITSPGADK